LFTNLLNAFPAMTTKQTIQNSRLTKELPHDVYERFDGIIDYCIGLYISVQQSLNKTLLNGTKTEDQPTCKLIMQQEIHNKFFVVLLAYNSSISTSVNQYIKIKIYKKLYRKPASWIISHRKTSSQLLWPHYHDHLTHKLICAPYA